MKVRIYRTPALKVLKTKLGILLVSRGPQVMWVFWRGPQLMKNWEPLIYNEDQEKISGRLLYFSSIPHQILMQRVCYFIYKTALHNDVGQIWLILTFAILVQIITSPRSLHEWNLDEVFQPPSHLIHFFRVQVYRVTQHKPFQSWFSPIQALEALPETRSVESVI